MSYRTRPGVSWKSSEVVRQERFTRESSSKSSDLSCVIGRIYQMNPVRIWGFCAEQTHKLLASEFVESGSLDRFLFDSQNLISVL